MPKILVLPGDGIGVEVTNVSLELLKILDVPIVSNNISDYLAQEDDHKEKHAD